MTVLRTDFGSPVAPRPLLLPRSGTAQGSGVSPGAVSSGRAPLDPAASAVSSPSADGISTEPVVRAEVVAAARAAVASGELLTPAAAEATALEFLRSSFTFTG